MIILLPSGLITITALPGEPHGSWCQVTAHRPEVIATLLPGAHIVEGASDGWRFSTLAPRSVVALAITNQVTALSYTDVVDAVPVSQQGLAELTAAIMAISAEVDWQPTSDDQQAPAPDQPGPSHAAQPLNLDASSAPVATDYITFESVADSFVNYVPVGELPIITYDGPSPVTTPSEDPFDALIPAEPTRCKPTPDTGGTGDISEAL